MASDDDVDEVLYEFECGYCRLLTNSELPRLEIAKSSITCGHPKNPKCKTSIKRDRGIPVTHTTGDTRSRSSANDDKRVKFSPCGNERLLLESELLIASSPAASALSYNAIYCGHPCRGSEKCKSKPIIAKK